MKLVAAVAGLFLLSQTVQRPSARPPVPPPTAAQIEPATVLNAERTWAGADVLWPLAASDDAATRTAALRAIGRLEDPENAPRVLALGRTSTPAVAAANAVAQSLNGFDPARDPALMASISEWLKIASFGASQDSPIVMPGPIASIRWGSPEQVHTAEGVLLRILQWSANEKSKADYYLRTLRAFESLGRLNARVTPFDAGTVTRLSRTVANTSVNDNDSARAAALSALIAARGLEPETELVALRDPDPQVRRLATAVLAGAGAGLDDNRRLDLIRERLGDSDGQVRYEAVRGYARRGAQTLGCGPLLTAITDRDSHVALAAIDALGDFCKDDKDVTDRVIVEAVPPAGPAWHRGAHAFVALAKRSPERAAISMTGFATHPSWWVRMYAARAAGAAGDVVRLEKLAYDSSDNVREAALGPLRQLKKTEADAAIVAALERTDVQLLRTAATMLKASARDEATGRALVGALMRLTKEGKETSRDARIPLLDAIAVHAAPDNEPALRPLLNDFDPVVAAKAATVLSQLAGKALTAEPVGRRRGFPRQFADLSQCVRVSLGSGKSFTLQMDASAAPVTVDRFLTLALVDRYYDGLTIHRVVPNFVIQGGGPGANEYSGHRDYMRDEIGARNGRGTVGLSTRGRNTADGQFFINLIDNPRLDPDYTVFASVVSGGMTVVDAIEEGEIMSTLSAIRCPGR